VGTVKTATLQPQQEGAGKGYGWEGQARWALRCGTTCRQCFLAAVDADGDTAIKTPSPEGGPTEAPKRRRIF